MNMLTHHDDHINQRPISPFIQGFACAHKSISYINLCQQHQQQLRDTKSPTRCSPLSSPSRLSPSQPPPLSVSKTFLQPLINLPPPPPSASPSSPTSPILTWPETSLWKISTTGPFAGCTSAPAKARRSSPSPTSPPLALLAPPPPLLLHTPSPKEPAPALTKSTTKTPPAASPSTIPTPSPYPSVWAGPTTRTSPPFCTSASSSAYPRPRSPSTLPTPPTRASTSRRPPLARRRLTSRLPPGRRSRTRKRRSCISVARSLCAMRRIRCIHGRSIR